MSADDTVDKICALVGAGCSISFRFLITHGLMEVKFSWVTEDGKDMDFSFRYDIKTSRPSAVHFNKCLEDVEESTRKHSIRSNEEKLRIVNAAFKEMWDRDAGLT